MGFFLGLAANTGHNTLGYPGYPWVSWGQQAGVRAFLNRAFEKHAKTCKNCKCSFFRIPLRGHLRATRCHEVGKNSKAILGCRKKNCKCSFRKNCKCRFVSLGFYSVLKKLHLQFFKKLQVQFFSCTSTSWGALARFIAKGVLEFPGRDSYRKNTAVPLVKSTNSKSTNSGLLKFSLTRFLKATQMARPPVRPPDGVGGGGFSLLSLHMGERKVS